ncbi:MAG: hypothetical protein M1820_000112 [Bogoriella megaspora]|nr:MAG: hypothetical protein M1820_000112 [Bogoriella megaspora]
MANERNKKHVPGTILRQENYTSMAGDIEKAETVKSEENSKPALPSIYKTHFAGRKPLSFPFTSLPPEIRNRIYCMVVVRNDPILIEPNFKTDRNRSSEASDYYKCDFVQPAVTRVSKQIRAESLPLFYAHNTFRDPHWLPHEGFALPICVHHHVVSFLFGWLEGLQRSSRAMIRRIEIHTATEFSVPLGRFSIGGDDHRTNRALTELRKFRSFFQSYPRLVRLLVDVVDALATYRCDGDSFCENRAGPHDGYEPAIVVIKDALRSGQTQSEVENGV